MRRALCVLFLLPVSGCGCGDNDLNAIPAPEAVLVYETQETPPLQMLEIPFGSQLLETTTEKTFRVENRGNAQLEVTNVVFGVHERCPVSSSSFRIQDPVPDADGLRTLTVGPQIRDEDPVLSEDIRVTFTPENGSPGCAVIDVHTNDETESGEPLVLRVLLTGQGDAPQLCTSTPVVDFGELYIGDTAEEVVVLESCGTRPIQLTAMMTNSQLPDPFGVTEPSLPVTLQPGATLEVPVSFSPLEQRAWALAAGNAGELTFGSDAGLAYSVYLEGSAIRQPSCQIDVVPVLLNFGSVAAGRDSTQSLVVRNLGDLDCNLESVEVRAPAGSFSATVVGASLPMVLAPGDLVSAEVTFAPLVVAGQENGFVDVTSDDPVHAVVEVPIQGISIEPTPCLLEAQPTGLNFGNQGTGRTAEQNLLLVNVGTETCSLKSVELISGEEDFGVVAGIFPFIGSPIQPGSSASVLVTFTPSSGGLKVGTVRAVHKELGLGNPDQNLDVPVTGNGVDAALCVTPVHLDFGSVSTGSSAELPFSVANCGAVDAEIRGIQLRAATHPDYSLPSLPSLPAMLPPGDSFQVLVRAGPTAQGALLAGLAMYGAVEVLSDDPDDPAIPVTLQANGTACEQGLVCYPIEVDFGEVDTATTTVRAVSCSNPSSSTVSLNPTTLAPFSVLHGPTSLAPGAVGVITVEYAPTVPGQDTGTLDIGAASCSGGPLTVALLGDAVENQLPACPTPETFSPEVVWHWEGGVTATESKQVWTTPLITRLEDTDGDGRLTRKDRPRVLFLSFNHQDWNPADTDHINDPVPGLLRAVDGLTGDEIFTVTHPDHRVQSSVTPIVADIDADGFVEIVAQGYLLLEGVEEFENGPKIKGKYARGFLIAFEHDGTFKWKSEDWHRSSDEIEDTGGLAVGDIDGDGFGEIAVGDHVFDHNGNLLWAGGLGTGSSGHGPTSFFADMDGQPGLELVTGSTVYRNDGSVLWHHEPANLLDWTDGHPAAADLDGDGDNELVVRGAQIRVYDGATGALVAGPLHPPTDMYMGSECEPGTMMGGEGEEDPCNIIPTNTAIVDVDNDGDLEIAVSAKGVILVYEHNLVEKWRSQVWDGTGASGPVGFDFENDGYTNVVYSDEGNVFVYDVNGQTIYDADRQSVTMMETVSIGDATNDGHANIAVGSNEPFLGTSDGLDLLTNTGTSWVYARGMWNQHAYMESLVGELGTLVFQPDGALPGFRTATPACR